MTRFAARSAAALATLAAVALVSCGGGSSTPADPTFTITLRFCAAATTTACVPATTEEFSQARRDVFAAAAARLEQIITAGLVPVNVQGVDCGTGADAIPVAEEVHGLLIFVSLRSMGVGILAQSGPCVVRSRSRLPLVAVMRFNPDSIPGLETDGTFPDVVLHEMFHTVGFGTVWCDVHPPLLANASVDADGVCSADPEYTGRQALAAAKASNGAPSTWTTVPAEDLGGAGTRLSHWRESVFHNELMTGYIDATDPLSATSIAALGDLGYRVNVDLADDFTLVSPPALRATGTGTFVGDDALPFGPAVVEEPETVP